MAAAELLMGLRSGTNTYSPSFLVASTVATDAGDCFDATLARTSDNASNQQIAPKFEDN